jgi:hypothetical protein
MEKDQELPSAFEKPERLLDSAGRGDRRVRTLLTVR